MYGMIILMLILLWDYLNVSDVIIIISIHTFIFSWRFYFLLKYEQEEMLRDVKNIKRWINMFILGSFMSGSAWGMLFFFMDACPPAYHFYIFAIVVGLAAIAMSTLGAIFSVFLSFMLPSLGIAMLWMTLQDGTVYTIAVVSLMIGVGYYSVSSRRFARNYKVAFIEKERAQFLKERVELALDGSNASILDWNFTNNDFYISENWKKLLGYSDKELANSILTWRERVHREDKREVFSSLSRHIREHTERFENIHRLKHKDGHYVWILGRARIFYDEKGKALRMIGTHTDITDEKNLQLKHIQQAQIIEQTHDSVITTDFDGMILSWNHGAKLLLGYTAEEAIGQHIFMFHRQEDLEEVEKSLEILEETGAYRAETTHVTKSGKIIDVLLSLSLLKDENGKPIRFVVFSQDITKRKQAQEKLLEQKDILDHQAHYDALTNLPNRVLFNDRLLQAIQTAKRDESIFALLFLDLDHFKEINDSLGHDIGDEVLKVVTRRLNRVMREDDTLARLGGDEFTIIMKNLTQGQDASLLAQKILRALSKVMVINENQLYVSASIGISLYPEDGVLSSNLLKYADAAMYRAKDEGRNNFQFYSSEMTELAFERVVMEASLRAAIVNEEFVVHYQAQVNGKNDELIGMEALVRWQHPTMGLVSPAKFIPLAESTGLIVELDQFVMKSAM